MIQVQPGDILLWRVGPGSPLWDRLIGWGQRLIHKQVKSAYYHVAFVGPGVFHYYESKPPRICNSDVPGTLPDYIEVYRMINPLTPDQLAKVFSYANSQLGKWYNFLGVLTFGFIQVGSIAFCSQFTWQSFTYAGVVLCPWEELESPDDIAASALLKRVLDV